MPSHDRLYKKRVEFSYKGLGLHSTFDLSRGREGYGEKTPYTIL